MPHQGNTGEQEETVVVFTSMPSMAGAGCGPQVHQQGEPRGAGQPAGAHLEPRLPLLLPLQPDLWLAEAAGKSHGGQGLLSGAQHDHGHSRTGAHILVSLQQELAFTVCLQYRYQGMDDFVEERQRVNVGRPLIAKLNLQASPSPPHSPLFSSSTSWGLVESSWVNTPEENLSPEGPSSQTL